MLALFAKVPTKDPQFLFVDSKYYADHGPLPHTSPGHVCKQTLYSKYVIQLLKHGSSENLT